MDPGSVLDGGNLDRLRDLFAGLGGRLANGDMLAWANPGDNDDVPAEVFGVVRDAGLHSSACCGRLMSLPRSGC